MRTHTIPISFIRKPVKKIQLTEFTSRIPTENPKPETKLRKEFLLDAIAQIATVKIRSGRTFDQSEGVNGNNRTNMLDTQALIDTRRFQRNKGQIDCIHSKLQSHVNKKH